MRYILSGAAAIALAASGALAQPGNGNGNGKGPGDRGKPAASAGKSDNGKQRGPQANRGPERKSERQSGPERRVERQAERRVEQREDRLTERGNGNGNGNAKRNAAPIERNVERRVERNVERRVERRSDRRDGFIDRVVFDRDRDVLLRDRDRHYIEGCPPGLAKKNNGCMPPGQAKKYYERSVLGYDYRPSLFGLLGYGSGRYTYNDGYLLRLGNGGGISGYIPLLGGALSIGNPWPSSYDYYPVPDYYVDYYDLGPRDRYRYADNVIYRYDAEDAAILSVAALLTGDDIRVGQPMPRGYDVYNVPYSYRDRYYDRSDAYYRYSDGYIYQVDPTTQLVAAVIDLAI